MKRKILVKVLLISIGLIGLVFVFIQLAFTFYLSEKIKNRLQQEVAEQTENEYTLEINSLKINIFSRSVYMNGFLFRPNLTVHRETPKYFASASEINLVSFDLFALLLKRNLTVSAVELVDTSGSIYRNISKSTLPEIKNGKPFSIYNLFKKDIHALQIMNININSANIAIYDDILDTIPSISSKDNEIAISNLKINGSTETSRKLFIADKLNLIIRRFNYTTRDSLYSIHVKSLTASYTGSQLTLDSVELIPNYSKRQFSKEAGKQTDRFNVTTAQLQFDNMDVKLFFERNWFLADELLIDRLNFTAYRNKNYMRESKKSESVQQLLKEIPFYANIDTIKLKNARIIYEETAEGATTSGKISFDDVNAQITGFTSDTLMFSKYGKLDVQANAKFMDSGKINAHYSFPLNTLETVFDCSGTLTGMPFEEINPMLVPNANISMKGGTLDSMQFSFHANETESTGTMKFMYRDLKMEFVEKSSKKSRLGQDILTFLAHGILIKENNPSHNQKPRVTEIKYTRNPNRFIFNYSWKSILSGIKPAIGIPNKL